MKVERTGVPPSSVRLSRGHRCAVFPPQVFVNQPNFWNMPPTSRLQQQQMRR